MTAVTLSNHKIASMLTNKFLDLIIMPTEECNFRCTYCYEDFSIGKMKLNTILAVKRLINARFSQLEHLNIEWFGGEPLVACDVVFEICEYVQLLRKQMPITFSSAMTTNAYQLLPEKFSALVNLGVTSYQISLDGYKEEHDKTRKMRGGRGSFDRIWSNLLKMKESTLNFTIILRVHVTPENCTKLPFFLEMIKETFGNDSRFTVFLKAIANLGGDNGGTFDVLAGERKEKIMKALYEVVGNNMKSSLGLTKEPYVCYAAKPNSFVIRANGLLSKCTVALNDTRNAVGKLNDDGTLTLYEDRLRPWFHGLKSKESLALSCPVVGLSKTNVNIPVKVIQA